MKVIAVEETPNPNARKFVVDTPTEHELSFFNADAAKGYTLAENLFAIDGVRSLLFLRDFITVNKSSEAKWADILKGVKKVLSNS
jgi:hypothetical protein